MSQAFIRDFIQTLPLPTIVLDGAGRVAAQNRPSVDLLGTMRLGLNYVTAFRQPALLQAIEDSQAAPDETQHCRYLGREGERDVVWQVQIQGLQGAWTVMSFQDVSPLQDAEQMRRDFVANVSHELRTPLTALTGFIETLAGAAKNDPEARARFLNIMADEAGRMTGLVEDLLALSRVEETERMRPMDQVNLRALVCTVCRTLSPVAEQAQVNLSCHFDDGALDVMGDEGQLQQVVQNLVSNGIKYGGSGQRVEIHVTHVNEGRGDALKISVCDFGDGIAPHHIARLTERFYRIDTHRSREVGGTGLGLAIVKHIVNRHRGRLRITSELGKGSQFHVVLPLT